MNLVDLNEMSNNRLWELKELALGFADLKIFRDNIKQVSKEEADKLGAELVKLLDDKEYRDNNELSCNSVLTLIMNGANIEYKTPKKGIYPLLVCARKNYFNTALILIRAGANINQVNNFLTTPVMACCKYGSIDVLNVLLLLGADVNMRYLDGETALMSAKRHDQVEAFNMLVNYQAHLNAYSNTNQSINNISSSDDSKFPSFDDVIMNIRPEKMISSEDLINELEQKLDDISSSNEELFKVKKKTTKN